MAINIPALAHHLTNILGTNHNFLQRLQSVGINVRYYADDDDPYLAFVTWQYQTLHLNLNANRNELNYPLIAALLFSHIVLTYHYVPLADHNKDFIVPSNVTLVNDYDQFRMPEIELGLLLLVSDDAIETLMSTQPNYKQLINDVINDYHLGFNHAKWRVDQFISERTTNYAH